jgi:hypothetical protein
MCIYGIRKDDIRIYSLQGGNLPNPQKKPNHNSNACSHKSTTNSSIQFFRFFVHLNSTLNLKKIIIMKCKSTYMCMFNTCIIYYLYVDSIFIYNILSDDTFKWFLEF